jgi:hypothetical protein
VYDSAVIDRAVMVPNVNFREYHSNIPSRAPGYLHLVMAFDDLHIWIALLDFVSDIRRPIGVPIQIDELHLYCQHAKR